MRVATNLTRWASIGLFLVMAMIQSSHAQTKKSDESFRLPSFKKMLEAALEHNADVRAAQAELDGARLHVAKDIRVFRDEWQAQLSTLNAAEITSRDFDRLSALPADAVAGKKLLEAKHRADSSRYQATLARAKLKEMQLMLPLLVGTTVAGESGEHAHETHDRDGVPAPVAALLRERLQLLMEVAQLQQAAYQSGQARFDDVASAQMNLLVAQLELAKSTNDRITIRQQMVQTARQIEEVSQRLFQAHEATKVALLKANALRLRAEADLKREQASVEH